MPGCWINPTIGDTLFDLLAVRQEVVVVRSVEVGRDPQLAKVVGAMGFLRCGFGPGQGRQQQRRQNRDNGNDNQ